MQIDPANVRLPGHTSVVTSATSWLVILIGVVVLTGWWCGLPALTTFGVGQLTMKANTALALVLAGLSLGAVGNPRRWARWLVTGGGAAVAFIAVLILAQFASGADFGINEVLVKDLQGNASASTRPGQMAPNTAVAFLLAGVALMLFAWHRLRAGQACALGVVAVVLLPSIGYVVQGSDGLAGLPGAVKMAGPTAIALSVLAIGLICARLDGGFLALASAPGPGGMMMRWLAPMAVVVPTAIGWLRWQGQELGWYGNEFGVVVMVSSMVLVLTLLVWGFARLIDGTDQVRRSAEDDLRAAHARLAALIAGCVDAIAAVDHERRLIVGNEAFHVGVAACGGRRMPPGEPLSAALPATSGLSLGCDRAMAGEVHRDTYTVGEGTGRRWYESVCSPMQTADGRPGGAVLVQREVTERVQAEALLATQRAALERSNAELNQFASVASHDLQEPLRMVGSYCTMLGERYRGRLDADADEIIGFAVDGAQRMRALIQDLLAYAKVDGAGGRRERIAVDSALDEALAGLGGAITDSRATVTRGPLPYIVADRRQMVQLLQNLVGNALKYRGADPPVVHVCAERDGGAWAVSVADNGIGIDPRHHQRIFGMFKRLHGRERYPGTGIGLAICRKIVEVHDGTIVVASTKGAGATFRFTIPDRDPQPEPADA